MTTPSFNGVVLEPGVQIWSLVYDQESAKTKKWLISNLGDNFKLIKAFRASGYSMLRLIKIVSESPDSGVFRTYLNGALSTLVVKGVEHDRA